jgi:thioredoxin-like negative regulator of GroEL
MPHLRGQSGDPHFVAGMKAYTAQECANAVRTLSQVPAQDEDSLAAQFYMGACQMHLGDQGAASRTWEHVAAAGDSPQQEAALYYLAQVSLQRNDATKARHYLSRTISLHGDFERRARSELTQVR